MSLLLFDVFDFVGIGMWFGLLVVMLIVLVCVVVVFFVVCNMIFGCYMIFVGVSCDVVYLVGVLVWCMLLVVYVVSGVLVGLVGLFVIVWFGVGDLNYVGVNFEFDVIVVLVIGGMLLFGGCVLIVGIVFGVLFL